MIALVVDIGGMKISAALIPDNGSFLLKKQISTPHERCPDKMIGALRLLVSEIRGTTERFIVTSIGIINNRVLTTLNPDNLGRLKEYFLRNIMEDITGLNGSVINDAQAATWVKCTVLPKEICDMVFITASTGAEGGIVVNRKLLTSVSGLAGYVGYILSGVTDIEHECGRRRRVEAISFGRATMGQQKINLQDIAPDIFLNQRDRDIRKQNF